MGENEQQVRGHPFNVGPRYRVQDFIGEGAYGIVVRAEDAEANENDNLGYHLSLKFLKLILCCSGNQKNFAFRSSDLLPADVARNQDSASFQS